MNYPYLSGYLESEIKNLAYDAKFSSLKSIEDKMTYLLNIIANANKEAKNYSEKIAADALKNSNYVGNPSNY